MTKTTVYGNTFCQVLSTFKSSLDRRVYFCLFATEPSVSFIALGRSMLWQVGGHNRMDDMSPLYF